MRVGDVFLPSGRQGVGKRHVLEGRRRVVSVVDDDARLAIRNLGGEIDFDLVRDGRILVIEAKVTPVDRHLADLRKPATQIESGSSAIVARHPSATFANCLWGECL